MNKWVSIGVYCTMLGMSFISTTAFADKVGFVDAVKLVETAPQGKQALKNLEDEFGEREQAILKVRDEVIKLEEEMQKNALVLSDADKAKKTKELREQQRELQRQQRELQEDYSLRRNEELTKLQKIVTQAVIEIAKAENYDLIFQTAVYHSPKTDMTDKVLAKLKSMYGK